MLLSIDTLKEYLGLPEADDPVLDPVLERSSQRAQTLVDGYLGFSSELDTSIKRHYILYMLRPMAFVRLPAYPVVVYSVKVDDVELAATDYVADRRLGTVQFSEERSFARKLDITYSAGYSPENVPADLMDALANIATSIYGNNGQLPSQSASSNALKSMTMFDAMSMSFDTSGAGAGTPQALVEQWAFVLDKYRVNQFTMA